MNYAEDYIHHFHITLPWKDSEIVRYMWILHHGDRLVRDLELWLCELDKQLEPMRLKIKAYDVSEHAYGTLVSRATLDLRIQFDEQMHYIFMNTHEDMLILFTCKNFIFQLEEAAYDEM